MGSVEADLSPALRKSHRPAGDPDGGDWLKNDGVQLVRLRMRYPGFRELRGGCFELGKSLIERPGLKQAVLVTQLPRVTDGRLDEEWRTLERLLRPEIFRRMGLIVLHLDSCWTRPGDTPTRSLAEHLRAELRRQAVKSQVALSMAGWDSPPLPSRTDRMPRPAIQRGGPPRPSPPDFLALEARRQAAAERVRGAGRMTPKAFEVFKVLLNHWCQGDSPVRLADVIRESGAAYPTVRDAAMRLQESGELGRTSNRRVGLLDFPRQTWPEVLALSRSLRKSIPLVDATGRPPSPSTLLKRLQGLKVPGLAVGGVVAARHWDRAFDLNGLPRLDLTWHTQDPNPDPGWVARLDPALRIPGNPRQSPIMVVHYLQRPVPMFAQDPRGRMPLTDPVETLLDLHEMRLVEQAEALIARFQKNRRP